MADNISREDFDSHKHNGRDSQKINASNVDCNVQGKAGNVNAVLVELNDAVGGKQDAIPGIEEAIKKMDVSNYAPKNHTHSEKVDVVKAEFENLVMAGKNGQIIDSGISSGEIVVQSDMTQITASFDKINKDLDVVRTKLAGLYGDFATKVHQHLEYVIKTSNPSGNLLMSNPNGELLDSGISVAQVSTLIAVSKNIDAIQNFITEMSKELVTKANIGHTHVAADLDITSLKESIKKEITDSVTAAVTAKIKNLMGSL